MDVKNNTFTTNDVKQISVLANIPVSQSESDALAKGFTTTMAVVAQLATIDVTGVEPTHQVTGLTNVTRDDVVDETHMFTQEQALSGAAKAHNGYFVVGQILDQE